MIYKFKKFLKKLKKKYFKKCQKHKDLIMNLFNILL